MSKEKRNPRHADMGRRARARAYCFAHYDICGICGRPIDKTLRPYKDAEGKLHYPPLIGEVDEIVPVSKGGDPFDLDNVRLVHRICNQRRGNKPDRPKPRHKPIKNSQEW